MKLTLEQFNTDPDSQIAIPLSHCCGSTTWIDAMLQARPFKHLAGLLQKSEKVMENLIASDWMEAFEHHPQIGDLSSLRKKFTSTAQWAQDEQKGSSLASEAVLKELAILNQQYAEKFGFIFIICATGKSASDMLASLKLRLPNEPARELELAASEQVKITELRLKKLFE